MPENLKKSNKFPEFGSKMTESTKPYSLRLIPKNPKVMRLTTCDDDVWLFVAV